VRPEGPEPAPAAPVKTLPPRLTGVGLIFASALAGGVVFAGSAWTMGRLASCEGFVEWGDCYDAHAGLMAVFVFGHKPVADLGAGLAAAAGWHWSRWRHWRGHRHDARRYRRIAWTSIGLLTAGVAMEIVGASLYFSRYRAGPWEDRGAMSIVAVLGSGAVLRIIGAGFATFGWGGQKWLKHGSGRVPRRRRGQSAFLSPLRAAERPQSGHSGLLSRHRGVERPLLGH